MKVLIFSQQQEVAAYAARQIVEQLRFQPDAVLGLATGATMEPIYAMLRDSASDFSASYQKARTFNLDEYVGLSADHPCSYWYYMRRQLFDHIDINPGNVLLPRGDADDPATEAIDYEIRIVESGGIDLQLLGIGENGHIGFNEPTSSLSSRTRIKTLTDSTRQANTRYFDSFEQTPRYAITMGIGTILDSRKCLLVTTGKAKAKAVARMIEGPLGADSPATALQLHPNVTVALDSAAAAELKLRSYYHQVHPGGEDAHFAPPQQSMN